LFVIYITHFRYTPYSNSGAAQLAASSTADKIIKGGRVSVNGDVIPLPTFLCFPGDVIKVHSFINIVL
jgi:ribosomal protein S4